MDGANLYSKRAPLVAQLVNRLPECRRPGFHPWVGKPLEKGKATHSSILAWRIPWTLVLGVTTERLS